MSFPVVNRSTIFFPKGFDLFDAIAFVGLFVIFCCVLFFSSSCIAQFAAVRCHLSHLRAASAFLWRRLWRKVRVFHCTLRSIDVTSIFYFFPTFFFFFFSFYYVIVAVQPDRTLARSNLLPSRNRSLPTISVATSWHCLFSPEWNPNLVSFYQNSERAAS